MTISFHDFTHKELKKRKYSPHATRHVNLGINSINLHSPGRRGKQIPCVIFHISISEFLEWKKNRKASDNIRSGRLSK